MKDQYSWVRQGRYIFFESLRSDLPFLYNIASSRLNEASSHISPKNMVKESNGEEQFTEQIQAYLNMVNQIYNRMTSDEAAFFNSVIDTIDLTPFKDIKRIINQLATPNSRISESDYKILIAFTNAIQNSTSTANEIKKNINNAYNNIQQLKTNFDMLSIEEQTVAKNNYINNMSKYRNLAGTLLKGVPIKDTIIRQAKTTSNYYAGRINQVLHELINLPEFITFVEQQYQQNINNKVIRVPNEQLKNLILNLVTDQIINRSEENINQHAKTIAKKIIEKLSNQDYNFTGTYGNQYANLFSSKSKSSKKSIKSLEEKALTTNTNLAELLLASLNAEEILQKYKEFGGYNELIAEWAKLKSIIEKHQKGLEAAEKNFNNKLRNLIANKLYEKDFNKELKQQIRNNSGELEQKLNNIDSLSFVKTAVSEMLPEFASGCNLTLNKSDVSEQLAAKFADNLPNLIQGKIPGNKINMKDDITFILKIPDGIDNLINKQIENYPNPISDEMNDIINSHIRNTIGNFLEDYRKASEGATDVAEAERIYNTELKTLTTNIEQYLNSINANEVERKAIWNKLNKLMTGAISVKDYTLYNNELGYHGGSLGSSGAPEGVIQNINKMYELGGITPEDKEALLFAILNCSPSAIGAYLKESLEQYLLGGAALIMFDEGFTYGATYVRQMQQELASQNFSGPKHLTLYYLNQTYIPGSYIIYNIYESLKQFYSILPTEKEKIKQRNRVVITNNASPEDIVREGTFQERFLNTAKNAEKEIKIQFLFMAGMLDILNDLADIFNQ